MTFPNSRSTFFAYIPSDRHTTQTHTHTQGEGERGRHTLLADEGGRRLEIRSRRLAHIGERGATDGVGSARTRDRTVGAVDEGTRGACPVDRVGDERGGVGERAPLDALEGGGGAEGLRRVP